MLINIVIVAILVWLIQQHKKLKYDYQVLIKLVTCHTKDIAGICSAAFEPDAMSADDAKAISESCIHSRCIAIGYTILCANNNNTRRCFDLGTVISHFVPTSLLVLNGREMIT